MYTYNSDKLYPILSTSRMILWTMAVITSYKQSCLFQFHAVRDTTAGLYLEQ